MKNKDGRYVIDETNILPDLLEKKSLYLNNVTKELLELNIYEYFIITLNGEKHKLIEVKDKKAAKVLFKDNRQRLPRKL
jgi:hypothetical protein